MLTQSYGVSASLMDVDSWVRYYRFSCRHFDGTLFHFEQVVGLRYLFLRALMNNPEVGRAAEMFTQVKSKGTLKFLYLSREKSSV